MNMRVARLVMIDPVRDLPAGQHLLDHELAHQRDVLLSRQLDGQREDEIERNGRDAGGSQYPRCLR